MKGKVSAWHMQVRSQFRLPTLCIMYGQAAALTPSYVIIAPAHKWDSWWRPVPCCARRCALHGAMHACLQSCEAHRDYTVPALQRTNAGLWPLRVPFWLLSFLLSLYVYPWVVIKAFFYVSAVLATLFLICQAVLVLSTAFRAWEVCQPH